MSVPEPQESTALLVLQTIVSGMVAYTAVTFGWAWVAVPMGAFCGWSGWLVARRIGRR